MVSNNNVVITNTSGVSGLTREIAFITKNFLIANGYTVLASSDGTTYSGSTDLWGVLADLKLATTTDGSFATTECSWVLLESASGALGVSGKVWTVICVKSTTQVGYSDILLTLHKELPTGGSLSTLPTSPSQLSTQAMSPSNYSVSWRKAHLNYYGKGCFSVVGTSAGVAVGSCFGVLPLVGVPVDYTYPLSLFKSSVGVSSSFLDSCKIWDVSGTTEVSAIPMWLKGTTYTVGVGQGGGGDRQGNHLASNIYLFSGTGGSLGAYGRVGEGTYNFGITEADIAEGALNGTPSLTGVHLNGVWWATDTAITP